MVPSALTWHLKCSRLGRDVLCLLCKVVYVPLIVLAGVVSQLDQASFQFMLKDPWLLGFVSIRLCLVLIQELGMAFECRNQIRPQIFGILILHTSSHI